MGSYFAIALTSQSRGEILLQGTITTKQFTPLALAQINRGRKTSRQRPQGQGIEPFSRSDNGSGSNADSDPDGFDEEYLGDVIHEVDSSDEGEYTETLRLVAAAKGQELLEGGWQDEEDNEEEATVYTYCVADYPSDDLDELRASGYTVQGILMPGYHSNPPRPTICLFELPGHASRTKTSWLGDHLYCNCVKCTSILEQTATPEEWQPWYDARTRWIARSRRKRAEYLEERVSGLAHKLQLKMKRSRMVVAMALRLSEEEIQDWDEKGRWDEKAREKVLEKNPHLTR